MKNGFSRDNTQKINLWAYVLVILLLSLIVYAGYRYIMNIRSILWIQNSNQTLEITEQGAHSFEVYLQIEKERVHSLVTKLSAKSGEDGDEITENLKLLGADTANYSVVDVDRGILYSNRLEDALYLSADEIDFYRSFSGSGLRENYLNIYNGHLTLGIYECFEFADGTDAVMQKGESVVNLSDEFSLSFYNESGFSYIINKEGNILIRPYNRNANLTFLNLFDIIEEENEKKDCDVLRDSMDRGHSGVIRYILSGEPYILTFTPIKETDGWYLISLTPSGVVLEDTNRVVSSTSTFAIILIGVIFLAGVFIVLEKVTHRKILSKERDIVYREQLFGILSQSIDDVFMMINDDGVTVEYITPNIERVLGISHEETMKDFSSVIGSTFSEGEHFHADDIKKMKVGDTWTAESVRIHQKTKEKRFFAESLYRTGFENSSKYIIVMSDRTRERQSSMALETALEAAKAANQSKTVFLSNMSHDIRTPMNTIIGLTTLIMHDLYNPLKIKEYTQKISSSSGYLLGLINNVLDMSKIESGKAELHPVEFNLIDLVNDIEKLIRPQSNAKSQTFEIYTKNITNEYFVGDTTRISQVLINLISNSVKYTQNGGTITLTVSEAPQKAANCAGLRFEVADNGMGMSEEFIEHIFDPFSREVNSTTNKIQGTGLGMPITKNLVEMMGGTIDVKSKRGEGSTFTVDIIVRKREVIVDKKTWDEQNIRKVLIVDDDETIALSVMEEMDDAGIRAEYSLRGKDAVEKAAKAEADGQPFDLVLLDWKMPELDGIETAKLLRSEAKESLPMILLTAYDWSSVQTEALEAGIHGFLRKPFLMSSFMQTVVTLSLGNDDESEGSEDISLEGLNVLAAEDNELNADILKELLLINGIRCDLAKNGQELTEKFMNSAEGEYDMILTDVQMPIMNGLEAARAIRACSHPRAKTIKIVAMTANAFADDVKASLDAGMDAHVSKPIDMDNLIKVIAKLIKEQ